MASDVSDAVTVQTAQVSILIDHLERPGRGLLMRPPLILPPVVAPIHTPAREVWEADDRDRGLHADGQSGGAVVHAQA